MKWELFNDIDGLISEKKKPDETEVKLSFLSHVPQKQTKIIFLYYG